ncbi:right-handed parallel beta-helix repeat-containing protein [Hymenobacter sp. BT186]|uniref:Right-handed parallel beta-helix repeat-containing protein n=1 Tax=Hymenobacter telluris TaxID=2816474 RepID=A0A939EVY9_9BACT|nr:glycosyl hydrolase family 28 protein [Hymenobacter telluris]MBO0358217.1 right-handed parallel beta-helix repeat-containing protein [Hymenobacter telluris]MBW3374243.1 right-handed parallel beta-helix repeat-containing protein [Hymenobacter norwichensis]
MNRTLLFFLFCVVALARPAHAKDYVITKFGASTDSTRLNTKAIQSAIDKASASGGGTIVIPKGVFLSGALFFKPKTQLRLEAGAKLKGSDNIADYPLGPSRMEGQKLDYYAALVNAYKVNNFRVSGPGKIDGNGLRFWKAFWAHRDSMQKAGKSSTNLEVHRPRLLFIWGCDNVTIENVKLHNAGFWTTHLYQCNNVLIEGCDIRSPFRPVKAPSTDAVDIDVCKKVTIRNCYISVNDDGIVMKGGKGPNAQNLPENGPIEDVLVENCTFGEVHAAVTCGSECIHANRITVRNCKVDNDRPLLLFKMRPDTYQLYENITIDNVTGKCGTIVTLSPWTQFFNMAGSTEKPFGTIRNITISNVKVNCKQFAVLDGNPTDKVENIVFKNVDATAQKVEFPNKYPAVRFENVTLNGAPLKATQDARTGPAVTPLKPD